jgi:hypothetical protein
MRFGLLCAAAALAACGAQTPNVSTAIGNVAVAVAGPAEIAHPDRGRSWMSPNASAEDLVYVSDLGTWDVDVYVFPTLKYAGKITGFDQPQGVCSDSKGNVWVTNTGSQQISEFAHGAKKASKTLADSVGYPIGCAIDKTTGNLAVTNEQDVSGSGSVLVYKDAGGTPTPYGTPQLDLYYFAGYDTAGDLYVDGLTSSHDYLLAVLPHGSNAMSVVKVTGATIEFPGTVEWNGPKLLLGDQRCKDTTISCLYEATVSSKTATVTGTITLGGACAVAQAWAGATRIVGADYHYCRKGPSTADVWPYPAGGPPTVKVTGLQMPIGATVSVAP